MTLQLLFRRLKGGSGSGNFGHSGIPGQRGGSAPRKSFLSSERFWAGQVDEAESKLDKLQTGELGEQLAIKAIEDKLGIKLTTLNVGMNNSPIDLGSPEMAVEVKAGLSSNGKGNQRWRANLGEFGKTEKDLVSQMNPETKREYFSRKSQAILERKNKLLNELSEMSGQEVKGFTAGVILSPDGSRGDVFLIPGFHLSLNWGKHATDENHIGSYEVTSG